MNLRIVLSFVAILCVSALSATDYVGIHIANNTVNQASSWSANTWYPVTGFTQTAVTSEWSTTSSGITYNGGGEVYLVKYSLSFLGTVANWKIGVDVNGSVVDIVERRITSSTACGNICGSYLILLNGGESMQMVVQANTAIASFIPECAQLSVMEVAIPTTASFSEMEVYNTGTPPIQNLTAANTWYDITGMDIDNAHMTPGGSDWTFASDALTYHGPSGVFWVSLSLSFGGDSGNDYYIAPRVNGSAAEELLLCRYITTASNYGNCGGSNFVTLETDDVITLGIQAPSAGNHIQVQFANLVLVRVSGESSGAAPYASMRVIDNNTTNGLSRDTWIVEPNTQQGRVDGSTWSYTSASDCLTPSTLAVGRYLVNGYASLAVPDGANTASFNCAMGVFVGTDQKPELTGMRTLERKTGGIVDIGAISCTGIIDILDETDIVDLRFQNMSNNSTIDTRTRYASVSLIRLDDAGDGPLPVVLSSFTATQTSENYARLTWITQSESDLAGYYLHRGNTTNPTEAIRVNDAIIQAGNSSSAQVYSYTDADVQMNTTYYYWLESVELDGGAELYGPITIQLVPGGEEITPPDVIIGAALYNAYPNPFNPSTTISFNIPEGQTADLTVFNLKGQLVRQWRNLDASHQRVVWNGQDEDGNAVSSGVYFYRLRTGQDVLVRMMMLIK